MADPEGVAQPLNPYEAVIADLRAKRDDIDRLIASLEAFRSGAASPSPVCAAVEPSGPDSLGPGAFLGMTIIDATKKLLAYRRRQMSNAEILNALKAGGIAMNAAEPQNVVGSVLTRRFKDVGDVVRVGRGVWGLKEWYPHRNFKKDASQMPDAEDAEESNVVEESELAETNKPISEAVSPGPQSRHTLRIRRRS